MTAIPRIAVPQKAAAIATVALLGRVISIQPRREAACPKKKSGFAVKASQSDEVPAPIPRPAVKVSQMEPSLDVSLRLNTITATRTVSSPSATDCCITRSAGL